MIAVATFVGFREGGKIKLDFDTVALSNFFVFGEALKMNFGSVAITVFVVFREGGEVKPDFDTVVL